MGLSPKFSNTAANAKANAQAVLLDGGFLEIYSGVQPVTADTDKGAAVRLATLTFGTPSFAPAVNGIAIANPIGLDSAAAASGTATWFRLFSAGHTPGSGDEPEFRVLDGSIGTSGCNLNLNSVEISSGAAVSISSFTLTEAKG